VREQAVCAALEPQERAELERIGQYRTLARGEALVDAGEENFACATLIAGALKIAAIDRDGTERIVALVHPAGFVGELFTPTAQHHVTALTDSTLCLFPRRAYADLVERHPRLGLALLRRSGADLAETRALIDIIGRRGSLERVAALLLVFARAAAHNPCGLATRFDLPLTRGEMAGLLGLTIETVSRQLTALERRGLIQKDGARGMVILDAPQLEELVR
jgi:CRP/FNR family transcriptional regulator